MNDELLRIKDVAIKAIPKGCQAILYGSRARGGSAVRFWLGHPHLIGQGTTWAVRLWQCKLSVCPVRLWLGRRNQPHHVHQERMGVLSDYPFLYQCFAWRNQSCVSMTEEERKKDLWKFPCPYDATSSKSWLQLCLWHYRKGCPWDSKSFTRFHL